MTKLDISLKIAQQVGVDDVVAKQVVQATRDSIVDVLVTEGRLEFRDFGVFEVRAVAARKGRNPRTGAQVMMSERRVHFKKGKVMRERVGTGSALGGMNSA